MNVARTILTIMLFAVCSVHGHQTVRVVHVGGDVPRPGRVAFADEGMTIDSAMTGAGMDLGPFYVEERIDDDGSRCPIRIAVFRQGKRTSYDPSVDAAVMRTLPLSPNDAIIVTDFRRHPKKIEVRKQRVERMVELGSTEIVDELLSLATLRSEYVEWRGQAGEVAEGSAEQLKKEASRLVEEGKGQRVLDLLDLRLGALQLDGLGQAHPTVKSTKNLIRIFRELVPE